MALYTGDYLRDTRHLSTAEHGCYLLLLMYCWDTKGPIPLDERKQTSICGARSGDEIEALRRVLAEFFTRMDDGHYNERMMKEIERSSALSGKRATAAAERWKARDTLNKMQVLSKSNASGKQVHSKSTNPIPIPNPINSKSRTLSGKPDDAVEILKFLNLKANRAYQPVKANTEIIQARLAEGFTVVQLRQVIAKKCREWLADDKMVSYLRPKTLFSRTNFANYAGELVNATEQT